MGPVSAEIEIDVPRKRAFELIGDLSRRAAFTDHFLADLRLTRIASAGVGAGARFRVRLLPRPVWMDIEIVASESPHRIVERGRGGRANRVPVTTVWELVPGSGSLTRVRVAQWTEPSHPLDRAVEALGGAACWQRRALRKALHRLRELLESEADAARTGVAGGNPHATGIP